MPVLFLFRATPQKPWSFIPRADAKRLIKQLKHIDKVNAGQINGLNGTQILIVTHK